MKKFLIVIGLIFITPFDVFCYQWPTVSKYITSDYGPRNIGYWDFHYGIDIRAPVGTNVYAVEPGIVSRVEINISGAGNYVEIDHGGMKSRYLHLSQIFVTTGTYISDISQPIALSGDTGGVLPHLHFDFGRLGPHPLKYLPYDNTSVPVVNVEIPEAHDGGFWVVKKLNHREV